MHARAVALVVSIGFELCSEGSGDVELAETTWLFCCDEAPDADEVSELSENHELVFEVVFALELEVSCDVVPYAPATNTKSTRNNISSNEERRLNYSTGK